MRKLKICSPQLGFNPNSDLGGEVHDHFVLHSLAKRGHTIFVYLPKDRPYGKHHNIIVQRAPFKHIPAFLFNFLIIPYLFSTYKKEKFDIVHTHTPKPALLGQMAAKMAGVPIIINTVHGLYFGNKFSFLKKQFYIFIERLSDGFSDLIFSQNKEDINTMRERKIGDQNKIKYLGNGIDLEVFDNKRFSAEFLNKKKEKLGLSESCKIVGAVGRLVAEKAILSYSQHLRKFLKNIQI